MKVFLYTTFALLAFAFNSILCRMALGKDEIDAVSFTAVRLVAGAVALIVISLFFSRRKGGNPSGSEGDSIADRGLRNADLNPKSEIPNPKSEDTLPTGRVSAFEKRGSWFSAFFLFAYAICFSFAYLGLTTATGALILFGSVQMTMVLAALFKGERPGALEWLGLAVAAGGLVYLVFPGLSSPPIFSSLLMAAAGIAWGFYTLRGRGSTDPLGDTTGNFIRSVPMIVVAAVPFLPRIHLSSRGIILAVLSGALASGVGYTVWYAALKYHTSTRAAVLQLAVPVIAAAGGVIFLSAPAPHRGTRAPARHRRSIARTVRSRAAPTTAR